MRKWKMYSWPNVREAGNVDFVMNPEPRVCLKTWYRQPGSVKEFIFVNLVDALCSK